MMIADLDTILEIEEDNFSHPWSRPMFLSEFKKNISYLRVIENQQSCISGYLVGWIILDEFHLGNIAVSKKHQRLGFAHRLLDDVSALEQINEMTLEVSHINEAAIQFYKKYGFAYQGVRKNYYQDGSDALLMIKTLRR
jgi:ribosomal-protein-alanine N-acetyltransferase